MRITVAVRGGFTVLGLLLAGLVIPAPPEKPRDEAGVLKGHTDRVLAVWYRRTVTVPRAWGARDVVLEICCALHNFRVRLTPW